jgi:hypothetical protein
MAPASQPQSTDPAVAAETVAEAPAASERSQCSDRRIPSARDPLATLPDIGAAECDFEPHDTIPAPTWLGDESGPPHEAR